MIDNLIGLAYTFKYYLHYQGMNRTVAERLVRTDMGAAAVQRHMPERYHAIVNEAKAWLREQGAALA